MPGASAIAALPQCAFAGCLFRLRLNTAALPRYVLGLRPASMRAAGAAMFSLPCLPAGRQGRCEHTPRFFSGAILYKKEDAFLRNRIAPEKDGGL